MPTYNLDPGEFVVLQQSGVWLLTDDGQDYLDELVLTNTHLILVATVSEGLFHSSRYLKRLPLEETLDDAGRPRVFVGKRRDKSVLSVSFATDSISLVFGDGSITAAKRWAESISSAAVGDLDGGGHQRWLHGRARRLHGPGQGHDRFEPGHQPQEEAQQGAQQASRGGATRDNSKMHWLPRPSRRPQGADCHLQLLRYQADPLGAMHHGHFRFSI